VSDTDSLKLDELATLAGTSPRTVRYYVQRGLLPAPAFRGKDTAYTREHLARLRAIRRLQERFLPLDAIQAELAGRTLVEIEAIADGAAQLAAAAPVASEVPAGDVPMAGADAYAACWVRWSLLPGLELSVAEGAADEVRELAEEIRRLVAQKGAKR
jgi:Ca-activated chloride channel family protein